MVFERQRYLKQLIDAMHNQSVKVIVGIRRSGKSFLLNTIFRRYLLSIGVDDQHIISVALDLAEHAELRDPRKLLAYVTERIVDSARYYISYGNNCQWPIACDFAIRFSRVFSSSSSFC